MRSPRRPNPQTRALDDNTRAAQQLADALSHFGALSHAVAGIGAGGGIGALGSGISAASRMGAFNSALGVAAAAVGALATATRQASAALSGFGRLRDTLGSSSSETALLRVLGGAVGVGDIRGLASRVRAAGSSGLGAAQMAQLGFGPQQDIGRAVNEGQILLAVMRDIRETFKRNPSEALARARNFGAEELVELGRIGEREFGKMLEEAKEIERTYSPARLEAARQFNREMERMGRTMERIKIGLATPALGAANRFIEQPFKGPGHAIGFSIGEAIGRWLSGNKDAVKENTQATRDLSSQLRIQNGFYGGGGRLRSALPGAFGPGGGFQVAKQGRAHAIRLGAYSVSM